MTAVGDKNSGSCLGQRHLQVFLLFLSMVTNYVVRLNAGVAIVAMTNAESTNPEFPEYDWDEMQKSYILSSFYWGYLVTQFPGGYFCRRFGAKRTMFVATFGSSIFTLATPFCMPWGEWRVYCGLRVIQGLFQGLLFPCIHANLAAWCPVNERNRLGALANTGGECGTVLAMFLSGVIATSGLGWPGISFVSGSLGLAWCLLWLLFATNTPAESKRISPLELNLIESSRNEEIVVCAEESKPQIPVPWRAILTSLPFWATVVARSAQSWGFSTLQAEIPSYMNGVLHMDMKKNAQFNSLPYLTMWCMSYVYLITSDILLNSQILSLTAIRRTFNSIAFWVPAVGLILVGFMGEDQKTLAIVLMTANVGVNSGATIGSALNTIDLSPNHAGILMGIANTVSNVIPIFTPILVGIIVMDEHDRTQWQIVFAIAAVVLASGNLFYIVFGSTKLQPWDVRDFLAPKEAPCESAENTRT